MTLPRQQNIKKELNETIYESIPQFFIVSYEWIRYCDVYELFRIYKEGQYQLMNAVEYCHVCNNIKNIQATFIRNGTSLYDVMFCRYCDNFIKYTTIKSSNPHCVTDNGNHVLSLINTINPNNISIDWVNNNLFNKRSININIKLSIKKRLYNIFK